jgi:DNA-binding beta-propeller fold protein YncE
VTDSDDDSVVVLALTNDGARPTRRFRVGSRPAQVVLGSDGRVYVTERGTNQLSVYDTRDGQL